jgi:predicted small lipoprotein YifL
MTMAALVVLALALAACGSGDDESGPSGLALPPAEETTATSTETTTSSAPSTTAAPTATTTPPTTAPPTTAAAPAGTDPAPGSTPIAEAKQVCVRAKLTVLPRPASEEWDRPRYYGEVATYLQTLADGLGPIADAAGWVRMQEAVDALEASAAALRERVDAIARGDTAAAEAAEQRSNEGFLAAFEVFNDPALDLHPCGTPD